MRKIGVLTSGGDSRQSVPLSDAVSMQAWRFME